MLALTVQSLRRWFAKRRTCPAVTHHLGKTSAMQDIGTGFAPRELSHVGLRKHRAM